MTERESKFADKLRELGFRRTGKNDLADTSAWLSRQLKRPLTRAERRRLAKGFSQPAFTREPYVDHPTTEVTDELGFRWEADGHIDLSPLGFMDGVEWMKKFTGLKTPQNYPARKH